MVGMRWLVLTTLFLLPAAPAETWNWDLHYRIAVAAGIPSAAAHGVSFPDMMRPYSTSEVPRHYMNADYFILSAMPDPFAIAGLNDALRDIMDAKERGNSDLVLLGVVISGVDKRTSLANSLSDFVEQSFRIGQNADSAHRQFR